MPVDFTDHYDNLYRIKCELDEAIASAYFDGRMYLRPIETVTGYTQGRIKQILTAANPQEFVSDAEPADRPTGPGAHVDPPTGDTGPCEAMPAANPLVMPRRKPRRRSKSEKLAWAMRDGQHNS